jgi:hypothetical protein
LESLDDDAANVIGHDIVLKLSLCGGVDYQADLWNAVLGLQFRT